MEKIFINLLAPSAYMSEKVTLDHGPSYTFGVKSVIVKMSDTPGK